MVVVVLCLARVKEKKKTTKKNNGGGGEQRRESFATKRRFISNIIPWREQDWNTTTFRESSLVPSFDLRDEDYSVVDVNDDTQTTTT